MLGNLEEIGARIFWASVSAIFLLIVAVFLFRLMRRVGGPVATFANTVESAAGLQG